MSLFRVYVDGASVLSSADVEAGDHGRPYRRGRGEHRQYDAFRALQPSVPFPHPAACLNHRLQEGRCCGV